MYSVNINGVWRSPSFSGDSGPLLDMLGGYPYLCPQLFIAGAILARMVRRVMPGLDTWISPRVHVKCVLIYLRITTFGKILSVVVMVVWSALPGLKQSLSKASSKPTPLLKGGVA